MTRVAVLGTGIMGSAMARNLLKAGLAVTCGIGRRRPRPGWRGRHPGGRVACGGGAGRSGHGDHDAAHRGGRRVGDVRQPCRGGVRAGSGVGTDGHDRRGGDGADRRAAREDPSRRAGLDAGVRRQEDPPRAGQLFILASGRSTAREPLSEPFAAIGRNTVWLGAAGQGRRLKLVVNAYMSTLIEGVTEAVELAGGWTSTWPPDAAIEGGPLDAPIAGAKLHKIATSDYAPEFPLQWALKEHRPGPGTPAAGPGSRCWPRCPAVACRRGRRPRTRRRQRCPPGAKRGPDRVSTPALVGADARVS